MASTRRERGRPKAGPFRAKPRGHGALDPCDMMHSTFDNAVATRAFPPRDPFSAPRVLQRGAELQRLEQLPWPTNRFRDSATIAELMAEAAQFWQAARISDNLCLCGCRREHKHRVSQTLCNPYGRGYDVIYFSSEACKSKWNRERMGRESDHQ
jgi:hypothetical protein